MMETIELGQSMASIAELLHDYDLACRHYENTGYSDEATTRKAKVSCALKDAIMSAIRISFDNGKNYGAERGVHKVAQAANAGVALVTD